MWSVQRSGDAPDGQTESARGGAPAVTDVPQPRENARRGYFDKERYMLSEDKIGYPGLPLAAVAAVVVTPAVARAE